MNNKEKIKKLQDLLRLLMDSTFNFGVYSGIKQCRDLSEKETEDIQKLENKLKELSEVIYNITNRAELK